MEGQGAYTKKKKVPRVFAEYRFSHLSKAI